MNDWCWFGILLGADLGFIGSIARIARRYIYIYECQKEIWKLGLNNTLGILKIKK